MNFYNENDPFAAAWLRELIKADAIAPGIVDERSIEDIKPEELNEYTQCHFFAGIGVWSYALRQAGWPDDRPVWTGSCPCQPFSSAGKGAGFADERHLWPSWFHLISECKPDTIFGEQVEAAIRTGWLDLVQNDLEGQGYSLGTVPFPACSVGAPHIRQRLYFVANNRSVRLQRHSETKGFISKEPPKRREDLYDFKSCGVFDQLADTVRESGQRRARSLSGEKEALGSTGKFDGNLSDRSADGSQIGFLADSKCDGRHNGRREYYGSYSENERIEEAIGSNNRKQVEERGTSRKLGDPNDQRLSQRKCNGRIQRETVETSTREGSVGTGNSFWSSCDWLPCIDGKTRPVEPGTFPLVNGATNRVGRLRGYGNAIVAPQAKAFIESYLETCSESEQPSESA